MANPDLVKQFGAKLLTAKRALADAGFQSVQVFDAPASAELHLRLQAVAVHRASAFDPKRTFGR